MLIQIPLLSRLLKKTEPPLDVKPINGCDRDFKAPMGSLNRHTL